MSVLIRVDVGGVILLVGVSRCSSTVVFRKMVIVLCLVWD